MKDYQPKKTLSMRLARYYNEIGKASEIVMHA